ncbi:MAG: sulfurtransferase TusA family protein [Wenzhouxiangellaceae bacterium]|nr:sulfurtransferase TusA family protein [Wenzhouxiangellaceae bacterium]
MTQPLQTADRTLDAIGLQCPEPVFRTRRELARMQPGERLEVRADDPLAELDLAVFCQQTGHQLLSSRQESSCLVVTIRKRTGNGSA